VKAVFLDRDGTLIDVVRDEETGVVTTAFHPNQLRLLNGVVPGLLKLRDAGYMFAIVTNQPGPAKGFGTAAAVARTHAALVDLLAGHGITIAAVAACMHHPEGGPGGDPDLIGPCPCRKPKPGLITDLLAQFQLQAKDVWMIGDTSADVLAGQGAFVRTGLVFARNRCELCPIRNGPSVTPDLLTSTFDEMAQSILKKDFSSHPC
jgi:D-glycero-D-manno-heptose 1,7-bisphosphate phosphatase